jgi:hypothetical protein
MKMVEEKTGVKTDEQRLIFVGKQLENGHTLKSYGITSGSTIHLVVR